MPSVSSSYANIVATHKAGELVFGNNHEEAKSGRTLGQEITNTIGLNMCSTNGTVPGEKGANLKIFKEEANKVSMETSAAEIKPAISQRSIKSTVSNSHNSLLAVNSKDNSNCIESVQQSKDMIFDKNVIGPSKLSSQ
jgi:hypothetical protein